MSASVAIAGVDSRITQIRGRIATLTRSSSGANTNGAVATGAVTGSAATFDPFGAAYQQALLQADRSSRTSSDESGGSSAGFSTGDNSSRVEGGVAVRVPGRAPRASGVATAGVATAGATTSSAGASTATGTPSAAGSGQSLSGTDVARMAYNAGFRGDDLVDVVAISKRESSWKPTAFNGNGATGDRSYGLMQINMIGSLGPARLQQFGLTSNDQLLDPQTNLNAAFVLYQRSGNSLQPWGGYKGMSNTFGTDVDAARQVVAAAGLADTA